MIENKFLESISTELPGILQVLGTFITEWEDGRKICERLFQSAESAEAAAKQLAAIAAYFGFEGWLINIENSLEKDKISHLLHFVRCAFIPQGSEKR